jgi:hypothetical protein
VGVQIGRRGETRFFFFFFFFFFPFLVVPGLFASLLSLHISKRIPVSKWTHSEVKEFAGATLGRRLAFNEISDGRSLLTMSDKDLQKYVSSDEVGRVKSRLNEEVEIEGAQLARQRQSLYAPPPTPSEVAEGLELKDALARAIFEHSSRSSASNKTNIGTDCFFSSFSLGIPFDVAILRDADLGHGAFVLSKYLEAVWEQKQALPELMFRREVHVGRVLESLRIVDERPDPPSQSPSMTPEAMMKLILQHETKISNLEHVVAQLAAQVQALSQPKTRRASLLKK